MKAINRTKIFEKYKGLWVGLRKDDDENVVSSGKTLPEALKLAHENGCQNPIMIRMPLKLGTMIGSFL
jgi:hypothetical protein